MTAKGKTASPSPGDDRPYEGWRLWLRPMVVLLVTQRCWSGGSIRMSERSYLRLDSFCHPCREHGDAVPLSIGFRAAVEPRRVDCYGNHRVWTAEEQRRSAYDPAASLRW